MHTLFCWYSVMKKGYRCLDPIHNKIHISSDVTFFESILYFASQSIREGELESPSFGPLPTPVDTPVGLPLPPPPSPSPGSLSLSPAVVPIPLPSPLRVYSRRPTIPHEPVAPLTVPISASDADSESTSPQPHLERSPVPPAVDLDVPIALRKLPRACTRAPLYPIANYISFKALSPSYRAFVSSLTDRPLPPTISVALADPAWQGAVFDEINALRRNHTWDIVDLPPGKKPVGCRWIFCIKFNSDGSFARNKARLVAKGYSQTYEVDYEETFAPVAKLNTVRVLLSLAVNLDWPLFQLDVKNAFLNRDLTEEVYMTLPPGFDSDSSRGKVCRLRKSIYGLKQSPRAWFGKFTTVVVGHGFSQAQSDHTLFFRHSPENRIAILIVYVDDIILTGDDVSALSSLKAVLAASFEMKDLGTLRYFLGMEVARSSRGICLSQRKYVLDLLSDTHLLLCKPVATPMDPNEKLFDVPDIVPIDKTQFQLCG